MGLKQMGLKQANRIICKPEVLLGKRRDSRGTT